MKGLSRIALVLVAVFFVFGAGAQADMSTYLDSVKSELNKKWPKNSIIKVVFHGHSVPAGYFRTPVVNSLESYPYQTLKKLHEVYPTAVISPIVTAIGGEQSEQGSLRFAEDVLSLQPDVIFIDYSLNDRRLGLEKAKIAWERMIVLALKEGIKVILLTPTPDLSEDILDDNTALAQHSAQVRGLAAKYQIGLVDSYQVFMALAADRDLKPYMAQGNHINGLGHDVVADEIVKWFF